MLRQTSDGIPARTVFVLSAPFTGHTHAARVAIEPETRLYLFSDGVFEIDRPGGEMWKFEEFVEFVSAEVRHGAIMDRLLEHVQKLHGSDRLSDDFSMVEIAF